MEFYMNIERHVFEKKLTWENAHIHTILNEKLETKLWVFLYIWKENTSPQSLIPNSESKSFQNQKGFLVTSLVEKPNLN